MPPKNLPETIGRYEVIDRLGQGGMGIVYRCRDPRIGRAVAIKLLRLSDDGLRDRFLQEARSAGNLQHRNIVTIFDFGEHEGQPFIVMQFVEGVTLSEQIRSGFQLSLSRKLELIEELSSGLDYAHNKGIVHRDVKPANAMIDRDGVLKILDFGIARVADSSLTQVGDMMGTPNYMSPEQIEGRPVDRRSDIFAVGLVAYELLTYRRAFSGEMAHAVMNAIVHNEPEPMRDFCPGLDPGLEAIVSEAIQGIVNKAIQKDPRERYQTLADMTADIAGVRARVESAAPDSLDQSTIAVLPPPAATPKPGRTPRPKLDTTQLSKRRAERIEGDLQTAQRAFAAGDFAAAVTACEQAELFDPDEPRVQELLKKAKDALDRQRVREWLKEAVACLDQQNADKAAELVSRVLKLDPASHEAKSLRKAIDELRIRQQQELRRQQAIVSALARARESVAGGSPESAILAASEILVYDSTHEEARELKRQALQAMLARGRESLAGGDPGSADRDASEILTYDPSYEEARDLKRQALQVIDERRGHARAAQAAVAQQRLEFAKGHRHEAVQALEQFSPPHDIVVAALADLRVELAAIERLEQEELERQRLEAEQRRQLQLRWVADQLEIAAAALKERRFDDAISVLEPVERDSPATPELATLFADARAGKVALEAEARRQKDIAEALTRAAVEFSAGRLSDARASLGVVLALEPEHGDARVRLAQVEAAIEAKERQAALDRDAHDVVEAARRQFEAGEHAAAIARLDAFAPPHASITRTRDELRARLARIERERHEAERRKRIESAREAVDRARRALWQSEFDDALLSLDEAEAFDPGNEHAGPLRARALAGREEASRRAERERLERETLAEERRRQADALKSALTRGGIALEAGDFGSAARLADEALAIDADSADAQALKARAVEGEATELAAVERAARQARIDEQYATVRAEAKAGQFAQALDRLQRLDRAEGPVAGLQELAAQVRADQTAAQARAREEERRKERQRARDRQARVSAALERARATESARDAVAILKDALQLDPDHRGCLDLLAARQAEIVSAIERLIDDREFDRALRALEETETLAIALPSLRKLRDRVRLAQSTDGNAHQTVVEDQPVAGGTIEDVSPYEDARSPEDPIDVLPVPEAPGVNWRLWGALAAGLLVTTGGAVFFMNRTGVTPRPDPLPLTVPSTVVTTSIPQSVATTSMPMPPSIESVGVEGAVAEARRLLAGQNLLGAARQIVTGWRRAPGNAALGNVLGDVLRAAAALATDARLAADRAGAASRPEYREASGHLALASRLKEPDRAEQAVNEYATATKLFKDASQLGPITTVATSTPTSVPGITSSIVPATSSALSTTPSSAPTTSVLPTTSLAPTIDSSTISRLLAAYGAASRSLDVKAIQQVYPGLPNSTKLRIDALRKDFSYCDYRFTNVRLVSGSATEATVRADSVEACKPKTAQKAFETPGRQEFHFSKSSSGTWILAEVFTAQ